MFLLHCGRTSWCLGFHYYIFFSSFPESSNIYIFFFLMIPFQKLVLFLVWHLCIKIFHWYCFHSSLINGRAVVWHLSHPQHGEVEYWKLLEFVFRKRNLVWRIVFTDELCSALYSFYGQPRCCLNLFLFFSGWIQHTTILKEHNLSNLDVVRELKINMVWGTLARS